MENKVKIWGGRNIEHRFVSAPNKYLKVGRYYNITVESDCIIFELIHTLDAPKNAHICSKVSKNCNRVFFNGYMPLGVYSIDVDESNENQLIVLLPDKY